MSRVNSVESADSVRLLSMHKHAKKKAATDAQLLMNRIALLQKEEERAKRKIERTKERANTIIAIRDENERKIERFVKAAEEEKQYADKLIQQHATTEEEKRMMKERQIKRLLEQKKAEVKECRIKKHKLRNDVMKMKEDDIRRKQERHEELKRQERETRERMEMRRREKDRKIKEHFELKAKMEEAEVRKAEALVRALEQKEKEWIQKLRETQMNQEHTFLEIESTLQQGSGSPGRRQISNSEGSKRRSSTDVEDGFAVGGHPEVAESRPQEKGRPSNKKKPSNR